MPTPNNQVCIGAHGELVIPIAWRKALNLEPGDRLVVRREGDSLVLDKRDAVDRRLRKRFRRVSRDVSLVDELIAERRDDEGGRDGGPPL